jgi:hypothetical protein
LNSMKNLIYSLMFVFTFLSVVQGEESIPMYTWDRGLALTQETQYQYLGFCSDQDCPKMVNPKSIGDAPFSWIPFAGVKKPFIVKTPFVEPHEKEGDIWKGMAAFVKEILRKQ